MAKYVQAQPRDILDAFSSRVIADPSLAAVTHDGVSTSYQALDGLAKRMAKSVQEHASVPSPRVLLALAPSANAYAAMIGTLYAGGTFCPVNIDGPETRNALIARLFSPDLVLFETNPPSFLDDLPATTPRCNLAQLETRQLDNPSSQYSEIAYVVFTSGSTGQPKGVKIGRAAFSHFLDVGRPCFGAIPGERWGQYSNLGYDLAVMDVFLAVTQGCTLVPLVSRKDRLMPASAIGEKSIAIWQSVPSVIELMIQAKQVSRENLAPLRVMSFCGEPLLPRHLAALFDAKPELQVLNTYGATETTGFNTINRLNAGNYRGSCGASTVALGEDMAGWSLSLRGGETSDEGEIVVSSDYLALGYWSDEDRTRTAFRQIGSKDSTARRSYFTGDWGERKDSRLYFACRIDRQVKIRGERIELDEIDYLLRESGFPAAYCLVPCIGYTCSRKKRPNKLRVCLNVGYVLFHSFSHRLILL